MIEQEISFNFSARYYRLGELTANTKSIWFVIHGYGQLAKYFLPKFSGLVNKETCVIAPEGLARFFLEDLNGRSKSEKTKEAAT